MLTNICDFNTSYKDFLVASLVALVLFAMSDNATYIYKSTKVHFLKSTNISHLLAFFQEALKVSIMHFISRKPGL